MIKKLWIFVLILLTARTEAQRLSIIDALHLNEELDYRTKRPIKIVENNLNYSFERGEIRDKIIKTFDQAGLLLTFEFYGDQENLFARVSYRNDTLSRQKLSRVMEIWRDNGLYKEASEYSYDSSRCLNSITDLDSNGNIIRKSIIVCNEKGHPVELSLFDPNDTFIAKEKATYFYSSNKVIRTIELSETPVINDTDSSKITLKNESLYPSEDEVFNSQGDKIKWKVHLYSDKDMYYEREYSYDHYGNWIESKIYRVNVLENGASGRELKSVISREITYP